jgi:hypothetical protein
MEEAYACEVRGGTPDIYFHRSGEKWRAKLKAFVLELDVITSFPAGTLPLRRIQDEKSMADLLAADRAILCLHAEWSMTSVMAWKSFQHWAKEREVRGESRASIPTFVDVNRDSYPPQIVAWLQAQGLDQLTAAGSGEILWLESGCVVSKLAFSHAGILIELTQRTVELWGADDIPT